MNLPSVPTQAFVSVDTQRETNKHLHGGLLVLARVAWMAVLVLALGLFLGGIPTYFAYLHIVNSSGSFAQLTPNDVRELQAVGLSLDFYAWFNVVFSLIFLFTYVWVGVVLFWRKSDDRMALLASLALVLFPLAFNAQVAGTLPPAWGLPTRGVEFLGNICFGFFFYLFPNGAFVPRWTRWLTFAWISTWGVYIFIPSASTPWTFLAGIIFVCIMGLFGSLIAVQVYRYRRVSNPVQRQQTKWVVFGISIGVGGFISGAIVLDGLLPLLFSWSPLLFVIGQTILSCFLLFFPLAIAMAVLRARLWDIDVLINRTLVYAVLTASLALVYIGLVIGLQTLLGGFTGNSDVAVVGSTLTIATLFQPLRRRIQAIIDRRFYRRKYDAARTLATFSASLRNEVDLNQLREQLVAVVEETMQPIFVSLWLRPPEHDGKHRTPQRSVFLSGVSGEKEC